MEAGCALEALRFTDAIRMCHLRGCLALRRVRFEDAFYTVSDMRVVKVARSFEG